MAQVREALLDPALIDTRSLGPAGLAALVLAAQAQKTLESLESRFEVLEGSAAAIAGARQRWSFLAWVRSEVVFESGAGELAALPKALAWRLHARKPLDVDWVLEGPHLVFRSEGEDVATLPRAILPRLLELLAEVPWEPPLAKPPADPLPKGT